MVASATDTYGGLDVAFNNAGIEAQPLPVADVTEAEWDRVQAVNTKGVWLSMKYEIPAMLARGGGAIVNASSILGLFGVAQRLALQLDQARGRRAHPLAPRSTTPPPASG